MKFHFFQDSQKLSKVSVQKSHSLPGLSSLSSNTLPVHITDATRKRESAIRYVEKFDYKTVQLLTNMEEKTPVFSLITSTTSTFPKCFSVFFLCQVLLCLPVALEIAHLYG